MRPIAPHSYHTSFIVVYPFLKMFLHLFVVACVKLVLSFFVNFDIVHDGQ